MRYNIGLLTDSLYDEYENKLWYELIEIAKNRNINLITFTGGAIRSPFEQNSKRNVLYNFVSGRNICGIISFSAAIGSYATADELEIFLNQFNPIPVVNIGVAARQDPAILIDNKTGMQQLMEHMINVHHYRQIAFIKGPEGNPEAEQRFEIYKDSLRKNHLPVNDALIAQGDFCRSSGSRAVAALLDERKVLFDSVIAANDYMAIDAMKELQNRGIRVPEDIAVVGFDDLQESSCLMHPLTTVRQPIYDIAGNALDVLLNKINHQPVETTVTLPARLVIRRSCGCFIDIENKNSNNEASSLYTNLLNAINRDLAESLDHDTKIAWANRLIKEFQNSLDLKNQKIFLVTLEDILIQSTQKAINILTWYPVISTLFTGSQETYKNNDLFNLLWKGSLIVIGNLAKQAQAHIHIFKNVQNYQLRLLSEAFRNIYDTEKQNLIMQRYLPELNIKSFYLGLYNTPDDLKQVTLLLAYSVHNFPEITGKVLSVEELIRIAAENSQENKILVLYPVYSDHEHLGIAVIEDGPQDGVIYETIGMQLNTSINEAKLFRQVQQQAAELARQVEARTKELIALNKELELKSKLDGLTNLYNRTAIYEFLANKLTSHKVNQWINDRTFYEKSRRLSDKMRKNQDEPAYRFHETGKETEQQLAFSLIMLDIDYFKKINDTYGHIFGDKVLRTLSSLLQAQDIFRKLDIAGRFGGEEFIMILPDTNVTDTLKVAERLKQKLNSTKIEYNNETRISITVSMGIAESLPDDKSNEDVIYRSDMALYYGKQHGRNRIVVYSDVFH